MSGKENLDLVLHYYPELESNRPGLGAMRELYMSWNQKVNLISRKDTAHFFKHHVLHALALAKIIRFKPGTQILDAGTGGGFPGVPLAMMFPAVNFCLVDSRLKKINVLKEIIPELELNNVTPVHARVENFGESFDFILGRAVTRLPDFINWVKDKVDPRSFNDLKNGIFYWKGGRMETGMMKKFTGTRLYYLSDHYHESYFREKYIVYVPVI